MLTVSAIKADVGGIGGHTQPSSKMMKAADKYLEKAQKDGLLTDHRVTFTGDDICLLMVHKKGTGSPDIHDLAWRAFEAAADIAEDEGLYGAGQDLRSDAPSGNVRGAGPGAAEIEFPDDPKSRPAEAFLVFTADKCGPGAFNFPLSAVFTNPMYCSGLLLPKLRKGWHFKVIEMEHAGEDKTIILDSPEADLDIGLLLRDENRYGIQAIHSRLHPHQQVVAASTDRLHSIGGEYKGKDDPVMIFRTQGIFPAPEEAISPYMEAHLVAGGARGSHHMPLLPVAINTPVVGPYSMPLIACLAYSVNKKGKLSEAVDVFGNVAWDAFRLKAQHKAEQIRRQGFMGPAMLPIQELEYSAFRKALDEVDKRFVISKEDGK
jgi:fructose 1,6-bisphosphate aldolase/phosphatase